MSKSKHDLISERIAKKEGTTYNEGKGPDIKGSHRTIEVVTHQSDLYSSVKQVQRFKCPYFAVPTPLIEDALRVTRGTGIGVMNEYTKIVKKSCRRG